VQSSDGLRVCNDMGHLKLYCYVVGTLILGIALGMGIWYLIALLMYP
jgi:hypothetical protein